jgi:hypothetical protein
MAVRRPEPPNTGQPDNTVSDEFDERRWDALLRMPGVIVRRRDPNKPIEPFVPTRFVIEGSMTVEDLLCLMGRRDDDRLETQIDRR